MSKRITPGQIKKTNRKQIYDHIYQKGKVSQQGISYELHLSRPTVAANLTALEEDGMIYKNGFLDSDQIGRKAVAYSIVPTYRVAVGVEIMRREVKVIAVDLYGQKIRREVLALRYENKEEYYKKVCDFTLGFIDRLEVSAEQVLGIGIALQGLVSPDGRTMLYAAILNCTGLTIDVFEKWLPYPCNFVHDPEAAAMSELWVSPELNDAVYMSLSRHLGGAFIMDRRIRIGKHGHSATYEHVQARPRGELCYCGKRGCWDTVCSMKALVGDVDADRFFEQVRTPGTPEADKWQAYLKNLAKLIGDWHLVNDVDFILGGHLAPYFTGDDLKVLYDEIRRLCPFDDGGDEFIRVSKMPSHNITIGTALSYIRAFLEDIG